MDQSNWKRVFAIVIALFLIAAFGCGKAAADSQKAAQSSPEVVAMDSGKAAADGGAAEHSGVYSLDGTTEESASGSYASSGENENAILVQNDGQLNMTSADINKTGDAQGDFSAGMNSAVAVLSEGQMTLSESNITTSALGAFGCYVSGADSNLTIVGSFVYTSRDSSPALVVRDGGTVSMTGGILSTEGLDSPCLLLNGGNVTLSGVSCKSTNNEFLRVISGENALTLDATAIATNPILGADARLQLKLVNGASFTGELGSDLPAKASVSLDASSKLSLAADTYVAALVDADATFQNIESNGFSLYYDSNAPENTALNSQSYLLPGGGFLSPMI